MTAPALILLAPDSGEPRATQVIAALRDRMQELRPGLPVHLAFAGSGAPALVGRTGPTRGGHTGPTPGQVIAALRAQGLDEAVFVPLDITHATELPATMERLFYQVQQTYPGMRLRIARPVGPACELLSVLDLRLRQALSAVHSLELDGLILSAPEGADPRGAVLMSRRARQWHAHHHLPVQIAHGTQPGHDLPSAIATLRSQGRRLIAVGSFFLTGDTEYNEQAEQALAHEAVAVSAPIGADERLLDVAMARYSVSALELLDEADADPDEEQEPPAPPSPPRLIVVSP
jgi:sirohydrochlorin ferrochelatase